MLPRLLRFVFIAMLAAWGPVTALQADDQVEGPVARLQAGDVENFVKTFPQLVTDMEALGEEFGDLNDPTAIQAAMAHEKVQAVFARHGWDQGQYQEKMMAIAAAYAAVKFEAELAKMPAEQRAMVKSMMQGSMAGMLAAHPADIELVRKQMPKLDAFFDDL